MAKFRCPKCTTIIEAASPAGLVCGNCGFGAKVPVSTPVAAPPPAPAYAPSQPVNTGYAPPPQPVYGQPQFVMKANKKNRIAAAIIAFFLGAFGGHKFYLGQIGKGIVYLIFFWTLIPAIIAFVEFTIYLVQSDAAFDQKYNIVAVQATAPTGAPAPA